MAHFTILRQLALQRGRLVAPLRMQQQQMPITLGHKFLQQHQEKQTIGVRPMPDPQERTEVSTEVRPLGEKIKENTKTATYTAIILTGISVTGIMFYAIFRELFSSASPNSIYSDALARVKDDPRVQDSLGAPIKGFGEETRRGRRQHAAHTTYERNGVPHMRMQFYVQGVRNKATVHLESRKNASGRMEYRYLFVQLDLYPRTTIILEDNRAFDSEVITAQQPQINNNSLALTSFGKK